LLVLFAEISALLRSVIGRGSSNESQVWVFLRTLVYGAAAGDGYER
jgi:hypothetical protein